MAGLLYIRTGNTGTDPAVAVDDLGITVSTGATWTLMSSAAPGDPEGSAGQFTSRELRDSNDLFTKITTGALEWSKDGSAVENSGSYIADYSLFQDFTDDDLDLSAGRLTLPTGNVVPASGSGREGEQFWKNDSNELYSHNGAGWQLIATASGVQNDHGVLVGLGDDDHNQYLLLGGNKARNTITGGIDLSGGTDFVLPQANNVPATYPSATEGSLAWDIDNDTLYAHNGTSWFGLAPASGIITDHSGLTGLLNDDHTQYGLLAGTAVRNVVTGTYDFAGGDIILPVDVTTPTGTTDGQSSVVGGVLSVYDSTRAKWLSVDRKFVTAAKTDKARDVYLRIADGIASSKTGLRAMKDGTITGMFAQTSGVETWTLEIRKNGVATSIASMVITAANGGQATTTNVDFVQGDELQFFANTAGARINDPIAGIEIAWKV